MAERAIEQEFGASGGIGVPDAAIGIVEVVARDMADAIREITVRRGHDPRDFTLVVGGGAGGLHAAQLAQDLGIRRVVIPRVASAFCAFGAAVADLRHDYTRSYVGRLEDLDLSVLAEIFGELESAGRAALSEEQVVDEEMRFYRTLDLRYKDQVYECTIEASDIDLSIDGARSSIEARFHQRHQELYDFSQPGYGCELISAGVTAVGPSRPLEIRVSSPGNGDRVPAAITVRSVRFDRDSGEIDVPVFAGEAFGVEHSILGPAIIEEPHTTIVILPQWRASFSARGAYILEIDGDVQTTVA
jgi:N-methylhydantoinase A